MCRYFFIDEFDYNKGVVCSSESKIFFTMYVINCNQVFETVQGILARSRWWKTQPPKAPLIRGTCHSIPSLIRGELGTTNIGFLAQFRRGCAGVTCRERGMAKFWLKPSASWSNCGCSDHRDNNGHNFEHQSYANF